MNPEYPEKEALVPTPRLGVDVGRVGADPEKLVFLPGGEREPVGGRCAFWGCLVRSVALAFSSIVIPICRKRLIHSGSCASLVDFKVPA